MSNFIMPAKSRVKAVCCPVSMCLHASTCMSTYLSTVHNVYCCALFPVVITVILCYLGIGLLEDGDSGIKPWMYTCVTVCVVDHLLVSCVMEYLQWKSAGEAHVPLGEEGIGQCGCMRPCVWVGRVRVTCLLACLVQMLKSIKR